MKTVIINKRIADAMAVLTTELRNDPDYYEVWKSGIATSVYDELDRRNPIGLQESTTKMIREIQDSIANESADKFLKNLIK